MKCLAVCDSGSSSLPIQIVVKKREGSVESGLGVRGTKFKVLELSLRDQSTQPAWILSLLRALCGQSALS